MKKHEVKLTEIIGHSKAEKSDYANLSAIFALRNFFQIPDADTKLPLGIPATKQAETDKDFEVIVEREAAKDGISEPDLLPHYRKTALKPVVEKLIREYNGYFDVGGIADDRDGLLLAIADKFVKYLGKGKPKDQQKTKRKPENLKDIWAGSDQDYNRIMKQLELKGYVEVRNGKIYWNCSQRGAVQYAAGFTYQMTKKGWLKDWQSAPAYKRIFENTFNFSFNPEPFKSLRNGYLKREYLDPFAIIPPRKQSS